MRLRARSLAATLLLALLVAGAALMFVERKPAPPPQGMRAGAFDPPHAAPDLSLRGSDGSEVTLARYRGKVVLLTFGFTYCAAVCPTTLATLTQARRGLGADADAVQVIFVTVDPERDDAAQMKQYLAAFDRSFIGATGTPEMLAKARAAYGVAATKEGAGPDYAMAHTSSIFLIDRAGKLRAMMPFGHEASDFVHDVNLLLAE
ncbi:SCO family protein [Sphingomonas sp. DG1-23]|uniref:SCO family protein n=1 Tax=Sphingomonas sp. DG1-23 TaxID=3068316 RepID=UPI00273DA7F3|nr:SCO family protein [Sphingomonas sp. DG1-23]MDP5278697.1 SCO family protein [Sphingomonas sp. DG1-23]